MADRGARGRRSGIDPGSLFARRSARRWGDDCRRERRPRSVCLCPVTAPPRAKITDEAARALAQHGRVAPVNIAQRVSYAETGATGQGVTETTDDKAGAEIAAIWDYVKGILDG